MRVASATVTLLFCVSYSVAAANSANYTLQDAYVGGGFLTTWDWWTDDDPTHGTVNYVDLGTALVQNLTYATWDKFVMRADSTNVVKNETDVRGRNSIRITSKRTYTDSVAVLDLSHMPAGCATWPAFWAYTKYEEWPEGGEIDIIEGVNLQEENQMSLHTLANCTMPDTRTMTGITNATNCDYAFDYNTGCGVSPRRGADSYGAAFNAAGGGWYVMQRGAAMGIRGWFWSRRDEANVPLVVRDPAAAALWGVSPDESWGEPYAYFPMGENCDYDTHFGEEMFTFDLTFCGDWAGGDYTTSGCPGNCTDLVYNHPEAFTEAYWEINGLYVYTPSSN